MKRNLTPEQRAAAALRIQQWKPWLHSTGPRTPEGKAKSALNRYQGGLQKQVRESRRVARHCLKALERINLEHCKMLWLEDRLKRGLSTTERDMQRAQLPNASIFTSWLEHDVGAQEVDQREGA